MNQIVTSWVQAISAVAVAFLTGFYVYYTRKLLEAAEKQRKDQKKPVVVFRFREIKNERMATMKIQDRLVNIGSGPAMNIQLFSNAFFNSDGNVLSWESSGSLNPWHSNYKVDNVLGPDTGDSDLQICFIESSSRSRLKEPMAHFEVTYNDLFGRSFKTVYKDCKNTFVEL